MSNAVSRSRASVSSLSVGRSPSVTKTPKKLSSPPSEFISRQRSSATSRAVICTSSVRLSPRSTSAVREATRVSP